MSRTTVSPAGTKAMRPLIELQTFDGTGSLDTFLTIFQCMAIANLCWSDEDMLHHLCASLGGAAGEVLWNIGPQASIDDNVCLLQNRFGSWNPATGWVVQGRDTCTSNGSRRVPSTAISGHLLIGDPGIPDCRSVANRLCR